MWRRWTTITWETDVFDRKSIQTSKLVVETTGSDDVPCQSTAVISDELVNAPHPNCLQGNVNFLTMIGGSVQLMCRLMSQDIPTKLFWG